VVRLQRISEERTHKEMIDPQLEKAGWYLHDHAKVRIEIQVDGYDAEPWNGVTDYCLYRENGDMLAVVEAKKTSVDARQAESARQGQALFQALLAQSFERA
jgi:type I site-specific restriction endonuclease